MTAKLKQNALDAGAIMFNAKILGLHIDGFGLLDTYFNANYICLTGNKHDCNFSRGSTNT
jgi:hypothetical protein